MSAKVPTLLVIFLASATNATSLFGHHDHNYDRNYDYNNSNNANVYTQTSANANVYSNLDGVKSVVTNEVLPRKDAVVYGAVNQVSNVLGTVNSLVKDRDRYDHYGNNWSNNYYNDANVRADVYGQSDVRAKVPVDTDVYVEGNLNAKAQLGLNNQRSLGERNRDSYSNNGLLGGLLDLRLGNLNQLTDVLNNLRVEVSLLEKENAELKGHDYRRGRALEERDYHHKQKGALLDLDLLNGLADVKLGNIGQVIKAIDDLNVDIKVLTQENEELRKHRKGFNSRSLEERRYGRYQNNNLANVGLLNGLLNVKLGDLGQVTQALDDLNVQVSVLRQENEELKKEHRGYNDRYPGSGY